VRRGHRPRPSTCHSRHAANRLTPLESTSCAARAARPW
jgi:hypothetical protein